MDELDKANMILIDLENPETRYSGKIISEKEVEIFELFTAAGYDITKHGEVYGRIKRAVVNARKRSLGANETSI